MPGRPACPGLGDPDEHSVRDWCRNGNTQPVPKAPGPGTPRLPGELPGSPLIGDGQYRHGQLADASACTDTHVHKPDCSVLWPGRVGSNMTASTHHEGEVRSWSSVLVRPGIQGAGRRAAQTASLGHTGQF